MNATVEAPRNRSLTDEEKEKRDYLFSKVRHNHVEVVNSYLEKNYTLPSYYATKGFDITYDILIRLASGKRLETTFKEGASQRVETRFDFREDAQENKGLYIIQYNKDLTLTKLK